ncbi:MAG: HPr kinase/phosphatase C-terminal domain-containing protein [Alphaproteobacteria bacterium]|nr:HPr kinase/phosphatase C-terminal domain-containing protein [Alphaproteobacteria bacterium]
MQNIHGSCIVYKDKGIMFIGPSAFGKSESCLKMIMRKNAVLLADDRVDLRFENDQIIASCPATTEGLLEIRGIGIREFEYIKEHCLDLVIELVKDYSQIERIPQEEFYEFEGIKIPKFKMIAQDSALVDKLEVIV